VKTKAQQHPTGIAALLSSAVVLVLARAGVDLSAEESAVVIGLVTAAVSIFTPRTT